MSTVNRIRTLRKERGLTQPELAAQTGISVHSINSYESGRRQPNSKAMATLERFFNVSGAYLRGETDDPHSIAVEDRTFPDGQMFQLRVSDLQPDSEELQTALSAFVEQLSECLTYNNIWVQQASYSLFDTAVTQCMDFIMACADDPNISKLTADSNRSKALLKISDALLEAQNHILKGKGR